MQRDINIAIMNETALVLRRLGLCTREVLTAARSKWNFLDFRPGLVGGNCLSVASNYFRYVAQSVGLDTPVIATARTTNESVPALVAREFCEALLKIGVPAADARALILGYTYKRNSSDASGTAVSTLAQFLTRAGMTVEIFDPRANTFDATDDAKTSIVRSLKRDFYHGVIFAVDHDELRQISIDFVELFCLRPCVIFDLQGAYPDNRVTFSL